MLCANGAFNVDEESISILLKTSHETGTKLVNIVKTVEKLGYSTISSLNIRKNRDGLVFFNYESFKKFVIDSIKNGEPIIVENVDYGGHYKVIIGLDQPSDNENMDILIFADPSDFYDGVSDGYNYFPAERFFYMWFDDHCLLKKNRKQPFLVIKKKQD
jgi:hypothetical protein